MNTQDKDKLTRVRLRHVRYLRFSAGIRELAIHHRAKLVILVGYLLVIAFMWAIRGLIPLPIPNGSISEIVLRECISIAILIVGVAIFIEIIIALGRPRDASVIENNLIEAGFTNDTGIPPLLLATYKGKHGVVYEFDKNNIPFSRWKKGSEQIGTALKHRGEIVGQSQDERRVIFSEFPQKVDWDDSYLSPDDSVLVMGESWTGKETVDISSTPHILLGGATGSGKSVLLKCLLMQSLKKGASVIIADFKGGVDYGPAWHKRCRMVFDPQSLLTVLSELTAELERRRCLFVEAGTPNIAEYNEATGADLRRCIFACDEIAEVMDTTGLSKEEKALYSKMERHLSLIARQGRAFGIHLIFATQRPSADLIPGQIRTNLGLRICGRADDILSKIILDSTAAADQIPKDAQGRFITNTGVAFQAYWFDDSSL